MLVEELVCGVGDELVADGGAEHDVLEEYGAGELGYSFVELQSRGKCSPFLSLDQDVSEGFEDGRHEPVLDGLMFGTSVGVVEQGGKDDSKWAFVQPSAEMIESDREVGVQVAGNWALVVGQGELVDGVEQEGVLIGPVTVDR